MLHLLDAYSQRFFLRYIYSFIFSSIYRPSTMYQDLLRYKNYKDTHDTVLFPLRAYNLAKEQDMIFKKVMCHVVWNMIEGVLLYLEAETEVISF